LAQQNALYVTPIREAVKRRIWAGEEWARLDNR
jgi:hypothetical protein